MDNAIYFGWLRPEVSIKSNDQGDSIRFAHWEVRLPRGTLSSPSLQAAMSRSVPVSRRQDDPELAGLLALLDAQGCFRRVEALDACSMRDFRRRFDPLRSRWSAEYYTHPLWNRLREGHASRNELLAWVVHNYHISRVAGAAAARCASRPYSQEIRRRFLEDTFDEYWHVNAYYFVRHPGLELNDEEVRQYVPLSGSRAFELLTLQVADRDPLGHLLIAYFQESTAIFVDDCVAFYRSVEQAYGLRGFFDNWVAHMNLDINEGHAAGLAQLFDSDRIVTPEEQLCAVRSAYMAFRTLQLSLDEVLEQVRPDETLDVRSPDAYIANAPVRRVMAFSANWMDLRADLQGAVLQAALACLGRTLQHEPLMLLGRLCQILCPAGPADLSVHATSIWTGAIGNLLLERIADPGALALLLSSLDSRCRSHGLECLPPAAAGLLGQLSTYAELLPRDSLLLAIDEKRIGEFIDLALSSPLIDTDAYSL
jgi:hypothetical protein